MKAFVGLTTRGFWELKFEPLSEEYDFHFLAKIFLNPGEESQFKCLGLRTIGTRKVVQDELEIYSIRYNNCFAIASQFEFCFRQAEEHNICFNPPTGLTDFLTLQRSLNEIEIVIRLKEIKRCNLILRKQISDYSEEMSLFKRIEELALEATKAIGHPEREWNGMLNNFLIESGQQIESCIQKLSEIEWLESEYLER